MTIDELLTTLRDLDAALYVEASQLRYAGPKLPADDPIRDGIAAHRGLLLELFTYAPGGRCVSDGCYRLRVDGEDRCAGPHLHLSSTPTTPGAASGREAARTAVRLR